MGVPVRMSNIILVDIPVTQRSRLIIAGVDITEPVFILVPDLIIRAGQDRRDGIRF